VREALIEREVLIRNAPHLTRPLRFVLPHHAGLRPAWMLRLGLFIYDHLGGRHILPGTAVLDLTHHVVGEPLKREFRQGFVYSDGWVDDARLVVLNALDAAERGAGRSARAPSSRAPTARAATGSSSSMRAASAKPRPRARWSMRRARGRPK
jgi:glycerol-3-phosphate dehydrogenase